jgi:YHS domain-containing protein/membrane-associated phospholipid phosphatase
MWNPCSIIFRRQSYNLNLAGLRRGLASLFVRPDRLLGTLVGALLAITVASRASVDEVTRWNQIATDASTIPNTDPLTETRIFAIVHVAIHDAVNAVESRYEPYLPKTSSAPGASVEAAIAGAAHDTLVALLPESKVSYDAAMEETLRTVTDDSRKTAGLQVGRAAAAAILKARENDGANRTVQYTPGTKPGEYCPTPPDFTPAFKPNWGSLTPFVLTSSAQFRPPEPPVVNSPNALADIEEVKTIGGSKSVTRTAEQSEIARYWFENSPRGWNRIAREVAGARQFDVWENARLFALVNLAMADGFIGGFECKYHYNYWRPVTAIRERGDSEWLSYLWTPPVPDYPSTHTVLGAAAATVMARFFNTDLISFSMTSGAPYPGITRKFWSFSEAARENGASRILCGIHFRTAVNEGYIQGTRIGEWVFQHALRPANPPQATTSSPASGKEETAPKEAKGGTTAKVNVDSQGVILKGYDAVAYFKQGKPVKGNPEIKSSYQSATYLFASTEDKADFDKDPAKYAPQYGGFCAYGVAYGVLADIEGPDGFVYKGKLYVCGDKNAGENFRTDLDNNIEKADTNWQKLSGS